MMFKRRILSGFIGWAVAMLVINPQALAQSQVLVSVGSKAVTAEDLQKVLSSSPFYTQFNTMDSSKQAALRGDFLKRLVASRLLLEEAESLKLDESPSFQKELQSYRKGRLYHRYMRQLRDSIPIPDEVRKTISAELKGNADAQAAVRSSYIAKQYKKLATQTVSDLRKKYNVKTWENRIQDGIMADTVLLQGDDNLLVRYGDVVDISQYSSLPDKLAIESELYKRAELELVAKSALDRGIDVSSEIASYRKERLPTLLLESKMKEWAPDEAGLKDYYDKHPELSKVPDQWLVGQIVLASPEQARAVRKRIESGESLYRLAGELSIDPYGKSRNGDMGWMIQGKGIPEIEQAIDKLDNGEISDVIKSPVGYHIVTVRDRKPGQKLSLFTVKERMIHNIVAQKRSDYLRGLQDKYKIVWEVIETGKKPVPAQTTGQGS